MNDKNLLKTTGRIHLVITSELHSKIWIYLNARNCTCIRNLNYFIKFTDGWKFSNGRQFPSAGVEQNEPFHSPICESNRTYPSEMNRIHISSQNFAMISYRIPIMHSGFTFTVLLEDNPE
ncbi:hypothetical protein BLA29_013433, partial [Euroglyphus maynei]